MASILSFLISSRSKKKEPRYTCLSEAKASHSHKMWTEVSSSVLHFLQVGLLLSPIIYKCLLKLLCPVRRLITTLVCVLLKDNNWALVARSGPEINSQACLCTTRTTPQYQMLVFHPALYLSSYILPRDPQERLRSNKLLIRTTSCKLVGDLISSHSGMPRDPIRPHSVLGRDNVQRLLHCHTQRRRYFGSPKHFKSRLDQWCTQEFCLVGGGATVSDEDRGQRERGSGGGSPLVRGSGDSCNLVQEISFHIVKSS
jgi:hypothetical protein